MFRKVSGLATCPANPMRASGSIPCCSVQARVVSTTEAASSEIDEEFPAVIVPSAANAGRNRLRGSRVDPRREPSSRSTVIGSSLCRGTSSAAISGSKAPCSQEAARWWAAAISSYWVRLIPQEGFPCAVLTPIES